MKQKEKRMKQEREKKGMNNTREFMSLWFMQ